MNTKLNLKKSIIISYSIPALFFIVFSSLVYINSVRTNIAFQEVDNSRITLTYAYDLILRVSLMARQARGYLLVKNAEGALQTFEKEKQRYLDDVQKLKERVNDPVEKENLTKIIELGSQFDDLAQRTFRLMDEGRTDEAINSYLAESRKILSAMDGLNQEFKTNLENRIKAQVNNTNKSLAWLTFLSLFFSILTLALFIGLIYLINRNLEKMGEQVHGSSQELEGMLNQQLASTNQVVVAAKEIAANSRELVKTIEDVAVMSKSTTQAATDSQKSLIHMEASMKQLSVATSSISNKLNTITEKADKINTIVSTITKVADQTNLLSLNASIEAEKAGEYGAGFSVVAREIRRLADQSAVATLDIEQMVKEMQASVTTGVMEMDKFTHQVLTSLEDVRNISMQMVEIIEKVQSLTPRFQMVSEGMEAQSEAAGQISDSMSHLSLLAGQTTSSLSDLKRVIDRLGSNAIYSQQKSRF